MEFCEISPDKGIAWLTEHCIKSYTLFELFIERNAHRGFQEVMDIQILSQFSLVLIAFHVFSNSLTLVMRRGE